MTQGDPPTRSALPPKLYFRIGEVASLVGVEPHVLRYWEREFRSIRPSKSAKGQRVYSRRDVENLMRVKDLLYAEGFTIAGAKKRLQRGGVEPREVDGAATRTTAPAAVAPPAAASAPVATLATATLPAIAVSLGAASPPVGASSTSQAELGRMRAALSELRSEVEAFLGELGS